MKSAISFTGPRVTGQVYYNDTLYKSLSKTENLYETVDSGNWTLAKLSELIKDSYTDLNGDTSYDVNDRYGLTFGDFNKYLGFQQAFDCAIFRKENGVYNFVFDDERTSDAIALLCSLVNDNEAVFPGKTNSDNPEFMVSTGGGNYASRIFVEGRSLFTCGLIADAEIIIPEIGFSYGLLPYPKFDAEQSDYSTRLQRSCYALIPTTITDEDAASAVLEALSSESYRTIIPEYCEVSLKVRYSQDEDVSRMFDLIRQSIVYDPGEIYGRALGTPNAIFRQMIVDNNPNWASKVATIKNTIIDTMDKITVNNTIFD